MMFRITIEADDKVAESIEEFLRILATMLIKSAKSEKREQQSCEVDEK